MTKNTWTPRTTADFQRMGYAWGGDGVSPAETRQMIRSEPRNIRRRAIFIRENRRVLAEAGVR